MKAKSRFVPRLAAAAVSCLAMMVVLSTFTFERKERPTSLSSKGSFPLYGFMQPNDEGFNPTLNEKHLNPARVNQAKRGSMLLAVASSATIDFVGTMPESPSCPTTCATKGYNVAWDATGQIVFSPKNDVASDHCDTYFGFVDENSTPPPDGSGSITLYDYMQNQYTATYTSTSFDIKVESCSYIFSAPKLNTESADGMYKVVYDSSKGPSCPAEGTTSCHESYWVTASASGVLAFTDTSSTPCPAFFAIAKDGSNKEQGTFTIAGVALERSTSWVPQGYSGSYSASKGTISISTPGCSVVYKLDPALPPAALSFASSAAPASGGSAILEFVGASSSSCPTACASAGYNVAWDASGQIAFSPRNEKASDSCDTFFGAVDGSATPPPYGSGSITIYDYMQNQYIATYTPTSFVVKGGDSCTFFFRGAQMNSASKDGLYKMVLNSATGPSCPAEGTTSGCFEGYWVTASASGVLAFADTSSTPCPAFFAVADQGSNQEQGTFTIAGVAVMKTTTWAPQGYSGSYSAAAGTISISTPGCSVEYKLDPSQPPAALSFAASAAPPAGGSATLEFVGASSPSCPTACASAGYNVAWDSTGQIAFSPRGASADGCQTYFGISVGDSTPPPYGSGSIVIYDYSQNQYTATYSPSSFVIKIDSCNYYFGGPKINTASGNGMYKMVFDRTSGTSCPADGDTSGCFESYWVTASASGVLAFADTSSSTCPAFFAVTNEGSNHEKGTFTIAGAAFGRMTTWAPEGYSGSYSASKETVTLSTPDCTVTYKVDSPSKAAAFAFPAKGSPPLPGSATLYYMGTLDASCPTACYSEGLNAAWDVSGQIILSPKAADPTCQPFFGFSTGGSLPPPYGSGSLELYDHTGGMSQATYGPSSFALTTQGCTFYFGAPAVNFKSIDKMYKMILSKPLEGKSCPAPSDPCFQSYWLTTTASGVFAFIDASSAATACAAFFALAEDGSEATQGSLAIKGVSLEREASWVPEGYSATYSASDVNLEISIRTPGCTGTYKIDPTTVSVLPASMVATPGAATIEFQGVEPTSPSCPTTCVSEGYNVAWDASGQIVFSPRHPDSADKCQTYFGFVDQGSSAPPEGSGSITIYDYMQNQYTATYSPSSFAVSIEQCTYSFGGPKINTDSTDGLYKMVLNSAKGPSCPADGTTSGCLETYWVTASASGVLAFADTSSGPCPAFFAVADQGSNQEQGTFTIAGVSLMRSTSWVPEGYSGSYSAAAGTISISTPGCLAEYKLDPSQPPAALSFAASAAPAEPGSATLEFVGASSPSCPTACASAGYNVAWDSTGQIVFSPKDGKASDDCDTYFGVINSESSPPPYGSGSITIYDYMQNQYMATYTPSSFAVSVDQCTYTFGGPKINTASNDGLYKMVLNSAKGPTCPAEGTTSGCFEGYWVTASAYGVLAFTDTSSSPCPAFFAIAKEGSNQEQGTFTIAGVAVMKTTTWAPQGYSGSYSASKGTISITTPGCLVEYKLDPALPPAALSFASSPASAEAGSATLEFVGASSPSCPTACASPGYNVAWDATGQMVFSPRNTAASDYCQTFFGYSLDGSTPPPYGSGTAKIYDYLQNQYIATYTPGSFMVKIESCTYFFGGPKINTGSTDGLYKMVFDISSGSTCAAASASSCHENYWVTASVNGIIAFVDTSSSPCPAFFAVADEGSNQEQGTFTIAGVALEKSTSWVPQGYSGSYSASKGTISITTPGCSVSYKLDQSMTPVTLSFASNAAPAQAGAATLAFVGASSPSCPTSCASHGYNVVWDSSGQVVFAPVGGDASDNCASYFGYIVEGSTSPPYGSGSIVVYDFNMQQYIATYSPTNFVVNVDTCSYFFGPPKITSASKEGLYKLALQGNLEGESCPAEGSTNCFQNYWLTSTANGVLTFVDAGSGPEACYDFVGAANEGSSTEEGTFTVGWLASQRDVAKAPEGYAGSYNAGKGTVTLTAQGCSGTYKIGSVKGLSNAAVSSPAPSSANAATNNPSPHSAPEEAVPQASHNADPDSHNASPASSAAPKSTSVDYGAGFQDGYKSGYADGYRSGYAAAAAPSSSAAKPIIPPTGNHALGVLSHRQIPPTPPFASKGLHHEAFHQGYHAGYAAAFGAGQRMGGVSILQQHSSL